MAIGSGVNPFLLTPGRLEEMESLRRLRQSQLQQDLSQLPSTERLPSLERPDLIAPKASDPRLEGISDESFGRIDRLVDRPLPGTGGPRLEGISDDSFQRIDRLVDTPLPGQTETSVVPKTQIGGQTQPSGSVAAPAFSGASQVSGAAGAGIPVQSTLAGAGTGAAIGTAVNPGIGTGIGAAVGAAGGLIAGLFSQSAESEERQRQAKLKAAEARFQGETQGSEEEQLALRNLLTGVQGPILR